LGGTGQMRERKWMSGGKNKTNGVYLSMKRFPSKETGLIQNNSTKTKKKNKRYTLPQNKE
jgi:hypothetical protein